MTIKRVWHGWMTKENAGSHQTIIAMSERNAHESFAGF
jgi:hypothetical protein